MLGEQCFTGSTILSLTVVQLLLCSKVMQKVIYYTQYTEPISLK